MIICLFMILGAYHGDNGFPVGKRQDGHLRTGQKFLDQDPVPSFPEFLFLHDAFESCLCLFFAGSRNHPFPQGKSVRLDHNGIMQFPQSRHSFLKMPEYPVSGSGNPIFPHQFLCKYLAGLYDRGGFPRSECPQSVFLQCIHHAHGQRIIRSHHGHPDIIAFCKIHNPADIRSADIDTFRQGSNAAVPRNTVQLCNPGTLTQFPDQGMFPAASAYHQYLHISSTFPIAGIPSWPGQENFHSILSGLNAGNAACR